MLAYDHQLATLVHSCVAYLCPLALKPFIKNCVPLSCLCSNWRYFYLSYLKYWNNFISCSVVSISHTGPTEVHKLLIFWTVLNLANICPETRHFRIEKKGRGKKGNLVVFFKRLSQKWVNNELRSGACLRCSNRKLPVLLGNLLVSLSWTGFDINQGLKWEPSSLSSHFL